MRYVLKYPYKTRLLEVPFYNFLLKSDKDNPFSLGKVADCTDGITIYILYNNITYRYNPCFSTQAETISILIVDTLLF